MSNFADDVFDYPCYTYSMRMWADHREPCRSNTAGLLFCPESEVRFLPRKPKRPCRYPGCGRLFDGPYCEEHRKAVRDDYNKYKRSPDSNKKYGRAWKRIRDRYAAAHPVCEMCLKEGRLTPVKEVHHILPISQGGDHRESNLMSLCQSCHTKVHLEMGDRQIRS